MKSSCRIPIPPSTNELYRNVVGKGRVKTRKYRAWIKAAEWVVHTKIDKIKGPVFISLSFLRGKHGMAISSDVSNRIKAAEDLLVRLEKIDGDTIKTVRKISAEVTFVDDEGSTCVMTVGSMDAER